MMFVLTGWSFFDPFHEAVEKGIRFLKEGKAQDAVAHFDEAAKVQPKSAIPEFDRAVALEGAGRTDEAKAAYTGVQASQDAKIASAAHYNLGNLLADQGETAPAIEEYLRALDRDPGNSAARRNLEIALRRKEEEQKQPKSDESKDEQKNQESQNSEDQQNKSGSDPNEEKKPGGPKEENSAPEDSKSPPEPEENQDQQSEPQKSSGQDSTSAEQSEQNAIPQEARLSREDAERLLNAIQGEELRLLQQLDEKKQGDQVPVTHDW